jgi:hypothetical protein
MITQEEMDKMIKLDDYFKLRMKNYHFNLK